MTAAGVRVREARADELDGVLGVLDAAALATDRGAVREALDAGDVLVAVPGGSESDDPGEAVVVGALVLAGDRIEAVAVRRRRRDSGVGTALVAAAAARRDRLVAGFDAGVRPFYEALGFDVEATGDGRFRGVRDCSGIAEPRDGLASSEVGSRELDGNGG